MALKSAQFILSAPTLEHCPPPHYPEVCFAGRSNVGKSTLINAVTNKRKLARTSNVPGKTREMNYYLIDEKWYIVDLPGYGYAKVPVSESRRWGKEIRRYILERSSLRLILLIMDIRHKPGALDEEFMYWLAKNRRPFAVILTKADKISKNKRTQAIRELKKCHANMNIEVPVEVCSTLNKTGIDAVTELIKDFVCESDFINE